jgi:hypothetical protein
MNEHEEEGVKKESAAPVKLFFDIQDLTRLVLAEALKGRGAVPCTVFWRAGSAELECVVMLGGTDAERDAWIASKPTGTVVKLRYP